MGAAFAYDTAARAVREPRSARQAACWSEKQYWEDHYDELAEKRKNGAGTDSIIAQRQARGAGYVFVRDWSELDGLAARFRCRTARPFAAVLLSLMTAQRLHCIQGSHEGLAEMMGTFGYLCAPGTIRNAIAELVPCGLRVEPWYDEHPEGFRCRPRRKDDPDESRRTIAEPRASSLYSLEPGSKLAAIVEAAARRQRASKPLRFRPASRAGSIRVPTVSNLSGAFASASQKQKTKDRASSLVDNAIDAGSLLQQPEATPEAAPEGKERPTAATSTAPPSAAPEKAPEKAAREGGRGDLAAGGANAAAKASGNASAAFSCLSAGAPAPKSSTAPRAAQELCGGGQSRVELWREIAALAYSGESAAGRAERLAELAALAELAPPANDDDGGA